MTAVSRAEDLIDSVAMSPEASSSSMGSDMYALDIRQQPKQARMCGSGEKADRRPLDPPPVIRLRIRKPSARKRSSNDTLSDSDFISPTLTHTLFMFASLVPEDSEDELYLLSGSRTKHVTGSVVSSLFHLKDQSCFVFPDLSVRTEGRWRFKMSLYEIVEDGVHFCKSITTDTFQVYSSKRFPGMGQSTELSRSFASQGLRLRIRRPAKDEPEPAEKSKPANAAVKSPEHGRIIRTSEALKDEASTHSERTYRSQDRPRSLSDSHKRKRADDPRDSRYERDYGAAGPWQRHYTDSYGRPLPPPPPPPTTAAALASDPPPSAYRGYPPLDPRQPYPVGPSYSSTYPPLLPHDHHQSSRYSYPNSSFPYYYPSSSENSTASSSYHHSDPILPPLRGRRASDESQNSSTASSARPETGTTNATTTTGTYRASFMPATSRSPNPTWDQHHRRRLTQSTSPPESHVAVFSRQVESSVRMEDGRDESLNLDSGSGSARTTPPTSEEPNVERKPRGSLAKLLGEAATDVKEIATDEAIFV